MTLRPAKPMPLRGAMSDFPIHYSISRNNTAGECARQAELLAYLGAKTRNRLGQYHTAIAESQFIPFNMEPLEIAQDIRGMGTSSQIGDSDVANDLEDRRVNKLGTSSTGEKPGEYSLQQGISSTRNSIGRMTLLAPSTVSLGRAMSNIPMSSTISRDNTADKDTRQANLLAHFDAKIRIRAAQPKPSAGGLGQAVELARGTQGRAGLTRWNPGARGLDPPIQVHRYALDRIRRRKDRDKLCNNHYLRGPCADGDSCCFEHKYRPSAEEKTAIAFLARLIPCTNGQDCEVKDS